MSMLALDCAADDRPSRSAPRLVPSVRPDAGELRWHVLLTAPQREEDAEFEIVWHAKRVGVDIDLYCPRFPQRRLCGRRKQDRLVPMFPTYLLAKMMGSDAEWGVIKGARGIREPCVLSKDVNGQRVPVRVPTAEIMIIEAVEAKLRRAPSSRPNALRVGQGVRIIDGPLTWFTAAIESLEKLDTQGRIKVAANVFGRMVPVELGCDQIELA